jgi:hypothetical protein
MANPESAAERQSRTDDTQILLCVYEGMRSESLQHRSSIGTSYGLAITAVTAIGGWALTQEKSSYYLTVTVAIVLMFVCIAVFICYIRQQRNESSDSLSVMRKIEEHYGLFEPGKYVKGDSILLEQWRDPPTNKWGLSKGDVHHVKSLALVAVLLIAIVVGLLLIGHVGFAHHPFAPASS